MGGADQKRHVSKASAASSSAQSSAAKRPSSTQQPTGVAAVARASNPTKESSTTHAATPHGKDAHHQNRHHHQPTTPSPLAVISNADERASSLRHSAVGGASNTARGAHRASGPEPRLSGSGKKCQTLSQGNSSALNAPAPIPLHVLEALEKLTLNDTNLQRAVQQQQNYSVLRHGNDKPDLGKTTKETEQAVSAYHGNLSKIASLCRHGRPKAGRSKSAQRGLLDRRRATEATQSSSLVGDGEVPTISSESASKANEETRNAAVRKKSINVVVKDSHDNLLRSTRHSHASQSRRTSRDCRSRSRTTLPAVLQKPSVKSKHEYTAEDEKRTKSKATSDVTVLEESGHGPLPITIKKRTKNQEKSNNVDCGAFVVSSGNKTNEPQAAKNEAANDDNENMRSAVSNCSLSSFASNEYNGKKAVSRGQPDTPSCALLKYVDDLRSDCFQQQLESAIADGTADAEQARKRRDDGIGHIHFMHVPHAVSDLKARRVIKHKEVKRQRDAQAADKDNVTNIDKNLMQKIYPQGAAALRTFAREMSYRRKLARRLCKLEQRPPEQLLCNTIQRHQIMETLRYKRIASEFERPRSKTQAERDLYDYFLQHNPLQSGDFHTQRKPLPPFPDEIEWRGTPALVSKEMGYGQLKEYDNDLGIGLKSRVHQYFTPCSSGQQFIAETLQRRPIIAGLEILGRSVASSVALPECINTNIQPKLSEATNGQPIHVDIVKRTESSQINLAEEVKCFDDARHSLESEARSKKTAKAASDTGYGSTSDHDALLSDNFVENSLTKSSTNRQTTTELYLEPLEKVFEQAPHPVVRSVLSTRKQRGIRIDLDPYGKLTVLHEPSIRANELRVSLATRVKHLKHQSFDIRNSGSVCMRLAWIALDKPLKSADRKTSAENVDCDRTNRYFYFDERDIVIEPTEVKTISVQFQPESAGIFIKRYRLVCVGEFGINDDGQRTKKSKHPIMYVTFEGYSYGKDLLRVPGQRVRTWLKGKVLLHSRRKIRRKKSWERMKPLPAHSVVDQGTRVDVRFAAAHHGRFFYQRDIVRQLNRIWMYLQPKPSSQDPVHSSTTTTSPKDMTAPQADSDKAQAKQATNQPVFPLSKPIWTAYKVREKRLQTEKLAEEAKIQPDKLAQANKIAAALLAKQQMSPAELKANMISKYTEKAVAKSAKIVNAKGATPVTIMTAITEMDDDEEEEDGLEDEESKSSEKDSSLAGATHKQEEAHAEPTDAQHGHGEQIDDAEDQTDAQRTLEEQLFCTDWTLPQMFEAIRTAPHITLNEKKVLLSYVGFLSQRLATPFEAALPASTSLPTPLALINQILFNVVDAIFDLHRLIVPRAFERPKVEEEDEEEIVASKIKLNKKRRTAGGGTGSGRTTPTGAGGGKGKKPFDEKSAAQTSATTAKRANDASSTMPAGGTAKGANSTLTTKSAGGVKSASSKKDIADISSANKKGVGNAKASALITTLDGKKSHGTVASTATGSSGSTAPANGLPQQHAHELRGSAEDGRMNWKTMNKQARKRFLHVLNGYVQKAWHRELVAGFNFLTDSNTPAEKHQAVERSQSFHRKKMSSLADQQATNGQAAQVRFAASAKIPEFVLNVLNNNNSHGKLISSARYAEHLIGFKNVPIDDELKSLQPRLEPLYNTPADEISQKHRINPQYGVPDDLLVQNVKIDSLKYIRDDFSVVLADQQRNKATVHKA